MQPKRRKNNRLGNYNYSQDGYYFITICTKDRKKCFGKIMNSRMILNRYGKIVRNQWLWLAKKYQYVRLDEYIVMPNHFHGILAIQRRDRSRPVPTGYKNDNILRPAPTRNIINRTLRNVPTIKIKSLSELIGAFKTTSSKLIHQDGLIDFAWQRSFYDHIIRNEKSLQEIRKYIKYNPLNWRKDRENINKKNIQNSPN